jgi:hypothetical protein
MTGNEPHKVRESPTWGADLYAAVRSVIGTATRRSTDVYQAIRATLQSRV